MGSESLSVSQPPCALGRKRMEGKCKDHLIDHRLPGSGIKSTHGSDLLAVTDFPAVQGARLPFRPDQTHAILDDFTFVTQALQRPGRVLNTYDPRQGRDIMRWHFATI